MQVCEGSITDTVNKLGVREYTVKLVQYVSYMSYCAVVNENKQYFSNEQMYHL